jgi:type II secretory pathway predicted ATPase ExeA
VWKRHWGLSSDPFPDRDTLFVPLPGHQEAVARLVHAIEAGHRLVILAGAPGLGKTRVLRQALVESRSPSRRIALVTGPADAASLFGGLADGLRHRAALGDATPSACWRALEQGVRICAVQGAQTVLAVDDAQTLDRPGRAELARLGQLESIAGGKVTALLVDGSTDREDRLPGAEWTLSVWLGPLSLTEAETYLAARLAAAGTSDSPFTGRAVTRLHLLSGGVPRGLDRLASLCLMAGASRRHEAISSELVDGVAGECHLPLRTLARR